MSVYTPSLVFCCREENDLYGALRQSGYPYPRFDTIDEAIKESPEGGYLLILSDGYPRSPRQLTLAQYQDCQSKYLTLYLEYFDRIPGYQIGTMQPIQWERCVVTGKQLGQDLPLMRILMMHDGYYLPVETKEPALLVLARVAGYDEAVLGLPEKTYPLLMRSTDEKLITAFSGLSHFIHGRYAPANEWKQVWKNILNQFDKADHFPNFDWDPLVKSSYLKNEKLPADYEINGFKHAVEWIHQLRLFPDKTQVNGIHQSLLQGIETRDVPKENECSGDGSLGFMEGYASTIKQDGSQLQRVVLRADCMAEVSMVLALAGNINKDTASRTKSINLLDYIFTTSRLCRGVRNNPEHPAYGMIAWGEVSPAWEKANYTDDNARVILAAITARQALNEPRWDVSLCKALLANLRTTGPSGFRSDRLDVEVLEEKGWKYFRDTDRVNYSTHHEAYMWACYLWAYRQTGFKQFLDTAVTGMRKMMDAYPGRWRWQDNIEKARMLLPLAWLIRVDDSQVYRDWLAQVAGDLLKYQDACGGIREIPITHSAQGAYQAQSNDTYGTGETSVVQSDGDPATDQLYTLGFALLGLHEAFAATGTLEYQAAENKLTEYLCRIQIQSPALPYLNGAWFRAFDYQKWEYWASSGDSGWGAWSIESGWGQAWISAILGLRQRNTSLWEFTQVMGIKDAFEVAMGEMEQL